jgi:hypothetical protein
MFSTGGIREIETSKRNSTKETNIKRASTIIDIVLINALTKFASGGNGSIQKIWLALIHGHYLLAFLLPKKQQSRFRANSSKFKLIPPIFVDII